MSEITYNSRILIRRGTAAEWALANPVLLTGELGIETDTLTFKLGNGVDAWDTLVAIAQGPPGADGAPGAPGPQGDPGPTGPAGSVDSVTGSAPITSTGGVDPVIGITAASTIAAGSMSAADKTKLDGIEEEIPSAVGEPTGVDPAYPTSISFTYGSPSTVTITPTGSDMVIWLAGVKHVLTGPQVVTFTPSDGAWFIYYQSDGWHASQTPWAIDADTAPAVLVYVNTTKAAGLLADERHGITMDWATHARLHAVDGSQISSGGVLSGVGPTYYPARTSNPSLGAGDYAVASAVLRDEDITLTVPALAEGGPYMVARRTGSGTLWTWETANSLPFFATSYTAGSNYIQYNQYTGGAWQLTDAADSRWVNYYVFATDFVDPAVAGYVIIPGQAIHTSLASAQAESVLGLDLGGFPSAEFAPLWKVTYTASSHANYNDMPGRCAVAEAPTRLVGFKSSVATSIAPSSHSALSNRSDASSHPASAIEVTPSGDIAATDLASALTELDGDKVGSSTVNYIVQVTQAQYDALTPDANTLYVVVG